MTHCIVEIYDYSRKVAEDQRVVAVTWFSPIQMVRNNNKGSTENGNRMEVEKAICKNNGRCTQI